MAKITHILRRFGRNFVSRDPSNLLNVTFRVLVLRDYCNLPFPIIAQVKLIRFGRSLVFYISFGGESTACAVEWSCFTDYFTNIYSIITWIFGLSLHVENHGVWYRTSLCCAIYIYIYIHIYVYKIFQQCDVNNYAGNQTSCMFPYLEACDSTMCSISNKSFAN